jgi:hypothetical protein
VSEKAVLEFFELYKDCLDFNVKQIYQWYIDWAEKQGYRRVTFRRFLFLLNCYLEENYKNR